MLRIDTGPIDSRLNVKSDLSTLPAIFSGADAITISTAALGRLKAAEVDLPDKPIVPFHYELTEDCESAVIDGAESVLRRPHGAAGAWPDM